MRTPIVAGAAASLAILTFGAVFAFSAPEKKVCIAKAPDVRASGIGCELIDILRGQAWVSTDWTLEAFEAFQPGIFAPHWIKNDPREGVASQTRVLRSPECENEGEFTYRTIFGRSHFHIADLSDRGQRGLTDGALVEGTVAKYHVLQFSTGQSVSFLTSPDGMRFVEVNRPVGWRPAENDLPAGWTLQQTTLAAPWDAELLPTVRVLRLADGSSYQGPLGDVPEGAE